MKTKSTFFILILISSFLILSLGENVYSQFEKYGCCQFEVLGASMCFNINTLENLVVCDGLGGTPFLIPYSCDNETHLCSKSASEPVNTASVPALETWGLISIVVVMGISGFGAIIYRRKKISA